MDEDRHNTFTYIQWLRIGKTNGIFAPHWRSTPGQQESDKQRLCQTTQPHRHRAQPRCLHTSTNEEQCGQTIVMYPTTSGPRPRYPSAWSAPPTFPDKGERGLLRWDGMSHNPETPRDPTPSSGAS